MNVYRVNEAQVILLLRSTWHIVKYVRGNAHREINGNRLRERALVNRWKMRYTLMCFILICKTIFDQKMFECFTQLPILL
jgi:hypothetical protein